MRARAKSSNTPYPVWVQGDYMTEPPVRPADGAERPTGHYIDRGGYPGANVYAVDPATLCRQTAAVDRQGKIVFENDFLLYETGTEIEYFLVTDTETAADIVTGEILEITELQTGDIKVIGNMIDTPDFVEGMRYYMENGLDVPYLPELKAVDTAMPFLRVACLKCGYSAFSCSYMARHEGCGGYFMAGFAAEPYKRRKKEQVFV